MFYVIKDTRIIYKGVLCHVLEKIYGYGFYRGLKLCISLGLGQNIKCLHISKFYKWAIAFIIPQFYIVGHDLKNSIYFNIKRITEGLSYKGRRYLAKLPCRGQNSRTNAKTTKNKRLVFNT